MADKKPMTAREKKEHRRKVQGWLAKSGALRPIRRSHGFIVPANEKPEKERKALHLLAIIGIILFGCALLGALGQGEPKTFASFLEMLQTAPYIDTSWLRFEKVAFELPIWLDWFNGFANLIFGIVQVLTFAIVGIIQALGFVLHFLSWCFLV